MRELLKDMGLLAVMVVGLAALTQVVDVVPATTLSSVAEWHALLVGVGLGLAVGFALRFGWDATGAFILGTVFGGFGVLLSDDVLFAWPAHRHAWYLLVPAAVVGILASTIALRRRGLDRVPVTDGGQGDGDPGLMLRWTSRVSRRIGLGLTKVLGRLGLIKVPYGDFDAAQGRRDGSRPDDQRGDAGGN